MEQTNKRLKIYHFILLIKNLNQIFRLEIPKQNISNPLE